MDPSNFDTIKSSHFPRKSSIDLRDTNSMRTNTSSPENMLICQEMLRYAGVSFV